jgi:hypothetical protein
MRTLVYAGRGGYKIRDLEEVEEQLSAKILFKTEKTKYENGLRYEVFDNGSIAQFPFCQNCDTDGKLVRINRSNLPALQGYLRFSENSSFSNWRGGKNSDHRCNGGVALWNALILIKLRQFFDLRYR